MTISDYLLILAVLIAPFLAVFAQKQIETWKSQRDMKLWIYKTLMASRGASLSLQHVQALNMIDLEYSDKNKKEKEVRRIWKEYLDHLASLTKDPELQKTALPAWIDKNNDYLAELLQTMGHCFGYNFDKVHIKRGIYIPQGHAEEEREQRELRVHTLKILKGEKPLSTLTALYPVSKEAEAFGQKVQKAIMDLIEGKKDFTVKIKKD